MGKQCPGNDLLHSMLSSVYCSLHYLLPSSASYTVFLCHGIPRGTALSMVSRWVTLLLLVLPGILLWLPSLYTCATTPYSIIPSLLCLLQRGHCVWVCTMHCTMGCCC